MAYGTVKVDNITTATQTVAVDNLAPKASPTFTGTPAAPTAAVGTDTTQIATTAYVQNEVGQSLQANNAKLTAIAGLGVTDGNIIVANGTTFVAESGATARTSLGAQASSAKLTDVAGLAVTDGGFIVGDGSNFVLETGSTALTSIGGQASSAKLTDIAGLAVTDSGVIVGNGSNFVLETGNTLRTSLGLSIGSDVQAYDADTAKTDANQNWSKGQRGTVSSVNYASTVTLDLNTSNNFEIGALTGALTFANPTNLTAGQSGVVTFVQDGTGGRQISWGNKFFFPGGTSTVQLTQTASAVDVLVYYVRSASFIACVLHKDLKA
jgi:hypothetical protein